MPEVASTYLPTTMRTDCSKGQIRGWLCTANRVNLFYHYTADHLMVKEKFLFGNIFILIIYSATNSQLPDVYDPRPPISRPSSLNHDFKYQSQRNRLSTIYLILLIIERDSSLPFYRLPSAYLIISSFLKQLHPQPPSQLQEVRPSTPLQALINT